MIYTKNITKLIFVISLCFLGFTQFGFTQTYSLDNSSSFLEVHGTSSLHDWHVDAQQQSGTLKLTNKTVEALSFSVKSESLESGKSVMDKKTYKALKTDDYDTIDFKLKSIESSDKISEGKYKVSAIGIISIAGKSKTISVNFDLQIAKDKVLVQGETPLLMTDFGIEPPKALLGTIKTGDKINVIHKTVFKL